MKNNITISSFDVENFKGVFCDENRIIKQLLISDFLPYFEESILDIGGGTADILSDVIPYKKVIHLDVLDFSHIPVPEKHERITGDLFDFDLLPFTDSIRTLFMSHVLQFLDSDIDKLNTVIASIAPKHIITVEDLNNDFLGEVMNFSLRSFQEANPEVQLKNFPVGYKKQKSVAFTATVKASSFYELTKQCLYLMDLTHSEENITKMKNFLEKKLTIPEFTINQEINLYTY